MDVRPQGHDWEQHQARRSLGVDSSHQRRDPDHYQRIAKYLRANVQVAARQRKRHYSHADRNREPHGAREHKEKQRVGERYRAAGNHDDSTPTQKTIRAEKAQIAQPVSGYPRMPTKRMRE